MNKKQFRVAVITTRNDMHLPFVERHLDQPFVVIDPQELLEGKELSFRLVNKKIVVTYGDTSLDNTAGVWYRKPQPILRRHIPVKDDYKLYSQDALERHGLQLLTAFEDATWVSDYFALYRANNKTLQLAIAKKIGFHVPDTVFTSNEKVALDFLKDHPKSIVKPLTVAHPKVDGEQRVFLTTLIDKKGKWWFLENNPNGQWAYIEEATGQPIGKAMADLLSGKPKSP